MRHGVWDTVQSIKKSALKVTAYFDTNGYTWYMETDVAYAPFDIMEDEQKFCRAVILDLKEVL